MIAWKVLPKASTAPGRIWWVNSHVDIRMECCRGKQWTSRKRTYRYKPPCLNPLTMACQLPLIAALSVPIGCRKRFKIGCRMLPHPEICVLKYGRTCTKMLFVINFWLRLQITILHCFMSYLYWDIKIFLKKFEKLWQKSSWFDRLRDLRDDLRDLSTECNVLILFVSLFE